MCNKFKQRNHAKKPKAGGPVAKLTHRTMGFPFLCGFLFFFFSCGILRHEGPDNDYTLAANLCALSPYYLLLFMPFPLFTSFLGARHATAWQDQGGVWFGMQKWPLLGQHKHIHIYERGKIHWENHRPGNPRGSDTYGVLSICAWREARVDFKHFHTTFSYLDVGHQWKTGFPFHVSPFCLW